jgi:hypothetical protein
MVDELIYSELARGLAEGDGWAIRGVPTAAYGFVYPLLLAPAYALFDSLPDAYAAVKAINAALMSLAAIPAYFLARRVLAPALSLLAALLAVAIPSTLYAGEVMTENAFYPLFLTVMLAFVATLERPTASRQLGLLALCVLAYLTRAQALAFFPAVAVAPVVAGNWRSFRVLYGALGGAVAAAVAVQLARGESPLGLLGAYAAAGEHSYDAREIARWLLYHVAELDLYAGIAPFAALLVLFALWRRLPRVLRPFLAATASISVVLLLEVSAFASLPSVQRIEERNLFYLVPLALVGLLVWVDQGAPRPPLAAGAAAVLAAALPGVIPYERLIGVPSQSDTLMLLALWRVHERWVALEDVVSVVVVLSVLAALAFLVVPRRLAIVLPLAALVFFAAVTRPISARMEYAAEGALAEGMNKPQRDWIDRAVGGTADVAVVWTGNTSRFAVWQNELFNRSVGSVLTLTPMQGGLPTVEVTRDAETGVLLAAEPLTMRYVLADGATELVGDVVASDTRRNVDLYEIDPPLRQASVVEGLHANDTWSGPVVEYTRFACDGGTVTVAAQSDPALYQEPSTVSVGGRVVARVPPDGRPHRFSVPLETSGASCVARFVVAPTKVPGPKDPRRLGLHFNSFTYSR